MKKMRTIEQIIQDTGANWYLNRCKGLRKAIEREGYDIDDYTTICNRYGAYETIITISLVGADESNPYYDEDALEHTVRYRWG